jgi:hypothetical protein
MMVLEEHMTTTVETPEPKTKDRPLLVGAVVILVVLALAVIAIVVGGRTISLDPDSPEGVVQRYTQAVIDGDRPAAESLLADGDTCDSYQDPYIDNDIRVTLGDVRITGDTAVVGVTIGYGGGDPFAPYDFSDRSRFLLTNTDGAWLIDETPWPFMICIERPSP